jgi:integrase
LIGANCSKGPVKRRKPHYLNCDSRFPDAAIGGGHDQPDRPVRAYTSLKPKVRKGLLAEIEGLVTVSRISDGGELVLPSIRAASKPLSENAMNSALRRMGYANDEMTAHGFRSAASTILNERGFNPDVVEAALAHQDENEVRRAYNRASASRRSF